jgi:hypothetical protein
MTKLQRFLLIYAILNLVILSAACTADWVTQATSIINLLIPAVQAALAILAAFGLGISPDVLATVEKWATESTNTLVTVVKPLIEQFNSAEEAAKPGILNEIQAALSVVSTNLGNILPSIHVTNPDTQAKIIAVVTAIDAEIAALLNLIPVVQGKVTEHGEVKARLSAVKNADEFRKHFNSLTAAFGPAYKI